jgi:hypothetical protein
MTPLAVRVHVSPAGNLFMTEIAALLRAAFDDLGARTELVTDRLPRRDPGWVDLVVAPHEFFTLHRGASSEQCLEAASASVLVTTEQPDTAWYAVSRRFAGVAPLVLDINEHGVDAMRGEGLPAHRLRLGYHPSWDRRADVGDRVHDVVFMGSLTPRREAQLARLGATLSSRDVALLVHDGGTPVTEAAPNFVWGEQKGRLLAASKILLNLHRGDMRYVEWHRLLAAQANGCAVLTEPVESYEPFEPWEHFFVAPDDDLADFVTMLLAADDLRARVAESAYELVRSRYRMTDLLAPFVPLLLDTATRAAPPLRSRAARLRARVTDRGVWSHDAPVTVVIPQPDPASRALKRSLLDHRRLARRVDALTCRLEHGTDQHVEVVDTPAWAAAQPDVAVVVPVHDYADHVGEALESAIASVGVAPEVIVVDDHSTDASRVVVERVMSEHADAAVRLVALRANEGLSAVRNRALGHVRAELVFFLDADNSIYPRALARLRDALRASDAALAYGMIEGFGAHERLISAYPFEARRLVHGNYIDAMAMIRRAVLEEVGGFSTEMQDAHGGWEDYELWLRLASRGCRGVLLPEIVGRYRVHATSMVSTVNLDVATVFDALRDRYPDLPWPAVAAAAP